MGGTTVRDDGVVPHALRRALEPLGIRPTDAEVASVRGAAKRAALAALIGGAAAGERVSDVAAATEETYRRFAAELQAAYAEGPVEEVAGAGALLRGCASKG